MKGIQDALAQATAAIKANAKRDAVLDERSVCLGPCITNTAQQIVIDISVTLKIVISVLGKGMISSRQLNP